MATLGGEETIEIEAPIARVWEVVSDLPSTPEWHGVMKEVEVLETDDEGRATLIDSKQDAGPAQVSIQLRFTWDPPDGLSWERTKGDMRKLVGSWRFEELGPDRTRATYALELDPGRVLGMLARGPLVDQLRKTIGRRPVEGLKRAAEGG